MGLSSTDAAEPPGPRASATRPASVFQRKTFKMPSGKSWNYALYVPPQYDRDPQHKWPLILFLHGSGECGTDGLKQTRVGLPAYIARHADQFPFITVMPQAHTLWYRGEDAAAAWAILEAVRTSYRVDPDRMYLTGLSMGGFATWEFAMSRPDVFAAAVPVCGRGDPTYAGNIRHLPIWAFHGRLDKNVPVSGSRKPIEALRRLGAEPKYTEFPQTSHVCWDLAYSNKALYRWLLRHRRAPPPRVIDYRLPGPLARVWWLTAQARTNLKKPAHIRAEVTEDGQVSLQSEGVVGWSIISADEPLKPGDRIRVTWNGKPVFDGTFDGGLFFRPTPRARSRPTSRP